jgi:hypothetical protein
MSILTAAPAVPNSGCGFCSSFLCFALPLLVAEIVMFVFYVTDGTPTTNRFGPDPKGRGVQATPESVF